MKPTIIATIVALCFCNCAGIERLETKHRSDSQLKLRLSRTETQLAGLRFGDGALRDINGLNAEHDAIERELLSRCEAGDRAACLPKFGQ